MDMTVVRRTDKAYQEIRERHYVENHGVHGQQIHFLIREGEHPVGIISGASSVYGVKSRDEFFGIPIDQKLKQQLYLPAIVNNVVFRLELHEKNLATQILARWRRVVSGLWEFLYEVPVIGFETFVVEEDYRKGTLYKADNWSFVGTTFGSTKRHSGLSNKSVRLATIAKLVYCKWNSKKPIIPTQPYISSWRNETEDEKRRNKLLSEKRESVLGMSFPI